jgi:glutaryl-CoA dehydrogenase
MRTSIQSELVLDDCRVPADFALPGAKGLSAPFACLNEARYGIAWGAVGAARACLEVAIDYSRSRQQFGRPIGAFQLTQRKLVDMFLETSKAFLLAHHLGRRKDRGEATPEQISFAKLNNVRAALEVARKARTILGGDGVTLAHPVIRHMNNLESVLTYEGTSEIHTLIVGAAITGMRAFT